MCKCTHRLSLCRLTFIPIPRKFSSPSPLFCNQTLFLSCTSTHTHAHSVHSLPVVIIAGIFSLSFLHIVFLLSEVRGVQTGTRSSQRSLPSCSPPLSLSLLHSRGSLRLSSRWKTGRGRRRRRREAGGGRRWWSACEREEGGTWQWGDAEREISLSPSLLRGRHWAPETGACGSFTGSGCFLIHWLAMDVRRGQWREGRGR